MSFYRINRLRSLLWSVFKDNYLILSLLTLVLVSSTLFWSLKFIKYVFGGYFASLEIRSFTYFKKILTEFGIFFCGNIILVFARFMILGYFNTTISKKIKISFLNKLLNNELNYFQLKNSSELNNYINMLSDSLIGVLSLIFMFGGNLLLETLVAMIFLALIDYRLMIGMIIILVIYWVIYFIFIAKYNKYSKEVVKIKIAENNLVNDIKNNILIHKVLELKNYSIEEYLSLLEQESKNSIKMDFFNYSGIMLSELFLGLVLVFYFILIYFIIGINELSSIESIAKYGLIVAYMFSIFYGSIFLKNLIQPFLDGISFIMNSDQIFIEEFVYERKNLNCPKILNINVNDINISFNNKNVLKNINLNIKSEEVIQLKGRSGIGKTTLCSVILGLLKPDKGSVQINSEQIDIYEIESKQYRKNFSYIPQVCTLYNKSIKDNITLGINKYSKKNFEIACILADVDSFVNKLENQYDFILQNLGCNLSGGQRSRVCIARSILRILENQSKFLICDEIFSSLSKKEAIKICQNIKDLIEKYSLTAIFIDHTDITKTVFGKKLKSFEI